MIKAVIIEDEVVAADNMIKGLAAYREPIQVLAVLRSVIRAKEWFDTATSDVDLVFADIKLPDGNSFEIFNGISFSGWVIFTTAYDEYALRAFQLNSIDYLLKPISVTDLANAIDKWQSVIRNQRENNLLNKLGKLSLARTFKERFLVKFRSELRVINAPHISYFISSGNFVLLYDFDDHKYPVDYSLEQLEELLDPELFFRATRSLIVSLNAVKSIVPYPKSRHKLMLNPIRKDSEFIVSHKRSQAFKQWLDGKDSTVR